MSPHEQDVRSTSTPIPSNPPTTRTYTGSCHCGHTRYMTRLTLPPTTLTPTPPPKSTVRLYKCNCTACHKMGIFHVRPRNSPRDFILLSPLDPEDVTAGLKDYRCSDGRIRFYFCGNCGVRCFALMGRGKVTEVDLEEWKAPEGDGDERAAGTRESKLTKIWRPLEEGWSERGGNSYLSVNAMTLDAGQEGLDLREWTEKKWVSYLDCLAYEAEKRFDRPQAGGSY